MTSVVGRVFFSGPVAQHCFLKNTFLLFFVFRNTVCLKCVCFRFLCFSCCDVCGLRRIGVGWLWLLVGCGWCFATISRPLYDRRVQTAVIGCGSLPASA